uniref:Uncharacterized protein n=1 Tax=Arundo donax TaxID=35708 RepID=A0A0A9EW46_ARUDO
MEAVVISMGVVLVVQVQAKTKPCAGFAESFFLRSCNSIIFPAALMHLCCARGISVCLAISSFQYHSVDHSYSSIFRINNITDFSTPTWCVKAKHSVGMIPGDGVGVGVDDLVGDALVEVAQDLHERARHPGGLVERHHVVGGGHPFPEPALQLRHHGRPPLRARAPRHPRPPRGGDGRRRREPERGRRSGLHALGAWRWWWLPARLGLV